MSSAALRDPVAQDEADGDDIDTETENEATTSSQSSRVGKLFSEITIEPLMLLHMIGMAGSSVVVQNLYIDRVCRIKLQMDPQICGNLSDYSEEGWKICDLRNSCNF